MMIYDISLKVYSTVIENMIRAFKNRDVNFHFHVQLSLPPSLCTLSFVICSVYTLYFITNTFSRLKLAYFLEKIKQHI